jgi:Flp pilus assembly protein TadD
MKGISKDSLPAAQSTFDRAPEEDQPLRHPRAWLGLVLAKRGDTAGARAEYGKVTAIRAEIGNELGAGAFGRWAASS